MKFQKLSFLLILFTGVISAEMTFSSLTDQPQAHHLDEKSNNSTSQLPNAIAYPQQITGANSLAFQAPINYGLDSTGQVVLQTNVQIVVPLTILTTVPMPVLPLNLESQSCQTTPQVTQTEPPVPQSFSRRFPSELNPFEDDQTAKNESRSAFDSLTEEFPELTLAIAIVGGEELTAILPNEEQYDYEAPLLPVTDSEGDTYVVQVLKAYETESGEHRVIANVGEGVIALDAEIEAVDIGLAPIITESGEIYVVEVAETAMVLGENYVLSPAGEGRIKPYAAKLLSSPIKEIPESSESSVLDSEEATASHKHIRQSPTTIPLLSAAKNESESHIAAHEVEIYEQESDERGVAKKKKRAIVTEAESTETSSRHEKSKEISVYVKHTTKPEVNKTTVMNAEEGEIAETKKEASEARKEKTATEHTKERIEAYNFSSEVTTQYEFEDTSEHTHKRHPEIEKKNVPPQENSEEERAGQLTTIKAEIESYPNITIASIGGEELTAPTNSHEEERSRAQVAHHRRHIETSETSGQTFFNISPEESTETTTNYHPLYHRVPIKYQEKERQSIHEIEELTETTISHPQVPIKPSESEKQSTNKTETEESTEVTSYYHRVPIKYQEKESQTTHKTEESTEIISYHHRVQIQHEEEEERQTTHKTEESADTTSACPRVPIKHQEKEKQSTHEIEESAETTNSHPRVPIKHQETERQTTHETEESTEIISYHHRVPIQHEEGEERQTPYETEESAETTNTHPRVPIKHQEKEKQSALEIEESEETSSSHPRVSIKHAGKESQGTQEAEESTEIISYHHQVPIQHEEEEGRHTTHETEESTEITSKGYHRAPLTDKEKEKQTTHETEESAETKSYHHRFPIQHEEETQRVHETEITEVEARCETIPVITTQPTQASNGTQNTSFEEKENTSNREEEKTEHQEEEEHTEKIEHSFEESSEFLPKRQEKASQTQATTEEISETSLVPDFCKDAVRLLDTFNLTCKGDIECQQFYAELISDMLEKAVSNGKNCSIEVPVVGSDSCDATNYCDQARQSYAEYTTTCEGQPACTAYYAEIIQGFLDEAEDTGEVCDVEVPKIDYCQSVYFYRESFYIGCKGDTICEQRTIEIIADLLANAAAAGQKCDGRVPTLTRQKLTEKRRSEM